MPRTLRLAVAAAALAVIAGCASTPKPAVVQAQIVATPAANPDARNRPSPVSIRLYDLKSRAAFDSADFFSLYDRDQQTLGAEMAGRDEIVLRPGEQRTIERTLPPGAKYLGVMVAFRDLERSTWRAVVSAPEGKTTEVQIKIDARSVSIAPR